MRRLKPQLTYANVTATLALVVAVAGGGTAIAVSAKKNSVTTKSIKNFNVTSKDLGGIRVVTNPLQAGAQIGTASCGAGERLIGGGVEPIGPAAGSTDLKGSYPSGNGWAGVIGLGGAQAVALCLKVKPGL